MSSTVRSVAGPGDIQTINIDNRFGRARISLLGATLFDWRPAGGRPVIWLSDKARFEPGRGIRGGVPLCWPWFGAHEGGAEYPAHGIARTRLWELVESRDLDDGSSMAVLRLPLTPEAMWPHPSELEYRVTLAEHLQLELVTRNTGTYAFEITQALHTYFRVGDIEQVTVTGLEGRDYLDKPDNYARKQQQGAVTFSAETDRIYLETSVPCAIEDRSMRRRIGIEADGSGSTVVWNPWREVGAKMSDMHDDAYRTMLCVETANAASDGRLLQPGEETCLRALYRVSES